MAFTGSFVCTSFKQELLQGVHNVTSNTIKMALYTSSAPLDATTPAYTATGEAAGTNYSAGGIALAGAAISVSGQTVILTFSNATFTNVSLTARGALIYNSTATNKAIAVLDFGLDVTKTAADLVVTFPPADAANALLRIL